MKRMNKFEKISYSQFRDDLADVTKVKTMYDGCEVISSPVNYSKTNGKAMAKVYFDVKDIYDKIKIPNRATARSAGYDFYAPYPFIIGPGETKKVLTCVKCRLDDDCVLLLDIRSSVGVKHGITLANTIGVVDADYYDNKDNEGHIILCLKNNGNEPVYFGFGNRIAQGVIVRYVTTEDDEAYGSRSGGFGSTGK